MMKNQKMFEVNKENSKVKTNDYDYIVHSIKKGTLDNPYTRETKKGVLFYLEEKDGKYHVNSVNTHFDDIENIVYFLLHSGKNIWFDLPYHKEFVNKIANPPSLKKRLMDSNDMIELDDWIGGENTKHGSMHGMLLGLSALGMNDAIDGLLKKEFSCNLGISDSNDFSMEGISTDPDLINMKVADLIKDDTILNRKVSNNIQDENKLRPEDDYKNVFKEELDKQGIKYIEISENGNRNKINEIPKDVNVVFIPTVQRRFLGEDTKDINYTDTKLYNSNKYNGFIVVKTALLIYPYTKENSILGRLDEILGHINTFIQRSMKDENSIYFFSNIGLKVLNPWYGGLIPKLRFIIQYEKIDKEIFFKENKKEV